MVTYTKSGDMWDKIAFEKLGSCRYAAELMAANPDKLQYFIFPAGVKLEVPEIEKTTAESGRLPSWY